MDQQPHRSKQHDRGDQQHDHEDQGDQRVEQGMAHVTVFSFAGVSMLIFYTPF